MGLLIQLLQIFVVIVSCWSVITNASVVFKLDSTPGFGSRDRSLLLISPREALTARFRGLFPQIPTLSAVFDPARRSSSSLKSQQDFVRPRFYLHTQTNRYGSVSNFSQIMKNQNRKNRKRIRKKKKTGFFSVIM
jgi:hypothetical protein